MTIVKKECFLCSGRLEATSGLRQSSRSAGDGVAVIQEHDTRRRSVVPEAWVYDIRSKRCCRGCNVGKQHLEDRQVWTCELWMVWMIWRLNSIEFASCYENVLFYGSIASVCVCEINHIYLTR